MFGLAPKLPISDNERQWVDDGFRRLDTVLGRPRMLDAEVILPSVEYFPDNYDRTPASAEALFRRVCSYMKVTPEAVELEIFADEIKELQNLLPSWRGASGGCAGLYTHDPSGAEEQQHRNMVVAVKSSQLEDPLALVATIAHELGHVILLGGKLLDPKLSDHEPLTDLLTVYLGLGIFTPNSAARFRQYQDERKAGWSMHRLGYLPEEVFGYAMARFAAERNEPKPAWAQHLSANVRAYYKRSRAWLEQNS